MLKVIIAGQDHCIRQEIMDAVDWDKLGILLIRDAEVTGGTIKMIREFFPDIMIVDNDKDDIDIFSLCKRARYDYPHLKIIIISMHKSFKYAQEAIRLGVSAYITRPVEGKLLEQAVHKCVSELLFIENIKGTDNKISFMDICPFDVNTNEFILSLLTGKRNLDTNTLKEAANRGINFQYNRFAICSLKYDIKIIGIVKRFASSNNIDVLTCLKGNIILCLFLINEAMHKTRLRDMLKELVKSVDDMLGRKPFIGFGGMCSQPALWPDLFNKAEMCFSFSFFADDESIIDYEKISGCKKDFECDSEIINKLKEYVVERKKAEVELLYNHLKDRIMASCTRLNERYVKTLYELVTIPAIYELGVKYKNMYDKFIKHIFDVSSGIEQSWDFQELDRFVRKKIIEVMNLVSPSNRDGKGWLVRKVVDFAHDNYLKKITLADAARFVNMNASYLCKIFKQENGMCFTDFLMKIRIEKSKHFLCSSKSKINEIATSVGFQDSKRFANIFKKFEGCTPSEYRKKVL